MRHGVCTRGSGRPGVVGPAGVEGVEAAGGARWGAEIGHLCQVALWGGVAGARGCVGALCAGCMGGAVAKFERAAVVSCGFATGAAGDVVGAANVADVALGCRARAIIEMEWMETS